MITRYDIAKHAGVSTATVSRVMNNMEGVSPELRDKVMKVVEELNYQPNLTAKGLKMQKSYNIAYLIPDVTNPYYTEIYRGINLMAVRYGYICTLIEASDDSWFNNVLMQRFDGVICAVDINTRLKEAILQMNIPVVMQSEYNIECSFKRCVTLKHNLKAAMQEAFNFIYSCGHRKIGLITKRTTNAFRHSMYKDLLGEYGLKYSAERVVEYQDQNYHYISGNIAMKELLMRNTGVTAVIAQNDLVAIGAMSAASEKGYTIPADISFLGCDDTVAAKFSNPTLTTIKLYKEKQGNKAAELLFNMIDGKSAESYEFDAELIIRQSIK